MSRDKAIAAALDALDGSEDISWAGMGAALDAALPHLVGEPVAYQVKDKDGAMWSSWDTLAAAREDVSFLVETHPKDAPYTVVAIVPVDEP